MSTDIPAPEQANADPSATETLSTTPSRRTKIVLLIVIVVLPVLAMLWFSLGRSPKPVDELTDGQITRRSTPNQAVEYALPRAVHPITSLMLPNGRMVSAQPNLPVDRDQSNMYIFGMVTGLVGAQAQMRHVPSEDVARRFARTAVSLPSHNLPSSSWPVLPVEGQEGSGKLLTEEVDGKTYISQANAARYDALAQMFTSVDTTKWMQAYVKAYPIFQKAYASLGHNYAGYYLNDAVVTAIDDLLATPEINGPIEVRLPSAGEAHADAARPWVTYRFADPALESLTVGQKTLLRIGPDHAGAVKAKLSEIRKLLVAGKATTE